MWEGGQRRDFLESWSPGEIEGTPFPNPLTGVLSSPPEFLVLAGTKRGEMRRLDVSHVAIELPPDRTGFWGTSDPLLNLFPTQTKPFRFFSIVIGAPT